MDGGGLGGGSGTTVGHGYDGSAVGADGPGDGGGGGGGGKANPGDSDGGSGVDLDAQKAKAGVVRLAAGAPLSADGLDPPDGSGNLASGKVLTAPDFRYDKTGLPRYVDGNKAVFSAMSYDVEGKTDAYGSSAAILTNNSFDDTVSWYKKNLPAGWSSETIGDLNQLGAVAQQFSPEKIMQMLAGGGTAKPDAPPAPTAAADRIRLSLFSPPAGTKGELGIMIVQKGDKPVEILMKTHVKP
jgi:hypothetical protein